MQIIIESIRGNMVKYSSKYGKAKGKWKGEAPQAGSVYNVEVELEGSYSQEENIFAVNQEIFQIGSAENGEIFTGILESVESDGYAILRMEESIIPFQINGKSPNIGDFIKVVSQNVQLYPLEY